MHKSKNHSKYSLKAHLVFVVKYRKKLINNDIDFFLKTKIKRIEYILERWIFRLFYRRRCEL